MPSPTPSRVPLSRRAALAGAGGALAAVAGSTLAATPAAAAVPVQLRRLPGAGGVRSLPLPAARSLLAAAGSAADLAVVSLPVEGGSMLGVTFDGEPPSSVAVRVTRPGAAPGPWAALAIEDGTTDPVWTGALVPGTVVDVRLPRRAAAGAHLAVVDPGPDPAPAVPAARGARTLAAESGTADAGGGPVVRPRADWGADESLRRADPDVATTLRAAVVHHTADGGRYSRAEVPAVIRGMYRYHTQTLGWSDLGYNVVVDRFGGIWEGRAGGVSRPVVGAHTGGFNSGTFGVSMMGDFSAVAPSEECLASVAAVIAWKFALHGLDARGRTTLTSSGGGTSRYAAGRAVEVATISAHRDLGRTACPGDVAYRRMDDLRDRVAARLATTRRSGGSAIARRYAEVDGPALLGAPTGEEGEALRGGRFRHYERGSIYHHPDTGTRVVRGTHRDKYGSIGWEWSPLGFPTADTTDLPGAAGSFTHFEHGSIYRRTGAQPHVVRGALRTEWAARGWERSRLGFPVSDEHDVPGGRASDFEGGGLRWDAATGRVREA